MRSKRYEKRQSLTPPCYAFLEYVAPLFCLTLNGENHGFEKRLAIHERFLEKINEVAQGVFVIF